MHRTTHAKVRGQQRGITEQMTDLILWYGTPRSKLGGAVEYVILNRELKKIIQVLERASRKAVLVDKDGQVVITQYSLK